MNEMPRDTAEGEFVQIKKIGNSLGLILSKDILSRLKLKEGDKLHIVEQTERGINCRRIIRSMPRRWKSPDVRSAPMRTPIGHSQNERADLAGCGDHA
jgi:putative addiction module antidote